MSSYMERFQAAEEAGETQSFGGELWKPVEGEAIIGAYLGSQRVESRRSVNSSESGKRRRRLFARKRTFVVVSVDTDGGLKKFSPGALFERSILPFLIVGEVYQFMYMGQKDLGGGHRGNQWSVRGKRDREREPGEGGFD